MQKISSVITFFFFFFFFFWNKEREHAISINEESVAIQNKTRHYWLSITVGLLNALRRNEMTIIGKSCKNHSLRDALLREQGKVDNEK